ncbi:hypothetical protein OF83DRAFT_371907 [Amylostereum chailletii]|nr:hypothetical protein OF83DRAFT_371907 [Amylostereum chailletii]
MSGVHRSLLELGHHFLYFEVPSWNTYRQASAYSHTNLRHFYFPRRHIFISPGSKELFTVYDSYLHRSPLTMFTRLSAKTIQEIAFYLSSSVDLHSLSLTNKHVHTALQDGLVYRQCIINAGWDVTDWSFDRPEWQSDEFYTYMLAKMQDLKLWKATCGTYTRMESFMERATVDDNLYFYHQNPLPALSFPSWGAPLVDCGARIIPFHKFDPKKYGLYEEADVGHGEVKVIDGQRAFRWMRHMGEFLLLISIDTHTKNVPRLLQDKFMGTWSVSLRALIGLSFVPTLVQGSDHPDVPKEYLELYYSNALERFSFSFLYLLLQSDKTCLESRSLSRLDYPAWFALIDQYFDPTSSDFVRDMFQVRADRQRPELLLRRFNVCFLVQILILLRVHCHHVVLGDEEDATFEYLFPDLDVPTLGEVMAWARLALISAREPC